MKKLPRVLLIDDDPGLRDRFLIALDSYAFSAVVAESPGIAARLFREHSFDVVICSRLETLATFRAATVGLAEPRTLVLTKQPHSRRWTMTPTVRFVAPPRDPAELRSLLRLATAA